MTPILCTRASVCGGGGAAAVHQQVWQLSITPAGQLIAVHFVPAEEEFIISARRREPGNAPINIFSLPSRACYDERSKVMILRPLPTRRQIISNSLSSRRNLMKRSFAYLWCCSKSAVACYITCSRLLSIRKRRAVNIYNAPVERATVCVCVCMYQGF